MTILRSKLGTIELDGDCPLEDAETLLQYLVVDRNAVIDWRSCTGAHTAVIQILLAAKSMLHGPPNSDFLRTHIDPLLRPIVAIMTDNGKER